MWLSVCVPCPPFHDTFSISPPPPESRFPELAKDARAEMAADWSKVCLCWSSWRRGIRREQKTQEIPKKHGEKMWKLRDI